MDNISDNLGDKKVLAENTETSSAESQFSSFQFPFKFLVLIGRLGKAVMWIG